MAVTELTNRKIHLFNINPNYLFFNHSCQPNISWHGACHDGNVGIDWLMTPEGRILQPGCSAVWCIAARHIKKDEQLTISYVGNPRGDDTNCLNTILFFAYRAATAVVEPFAEPCTLHFSPSFSSIISSGIPNI